jgi:hypothetical protein
MSNLVLGYPDLLFPDPRVTVPALSGGSWNPALPLSNLFKLDFASVARSTNSLETSTRFWADLGLMRSVRLVAIPRSNASRIAKCRVRGFAPGPGDTFPDEACHRASPATYFDGLGVLQTAAANVPRYAYDPVTHAAQGLLIEPTGSTNLITDSSDMTVSSFWSSLAALLVIPNATSAPDGTLTADKLAATNVSGQHAIWHTSVAITPGSTFTSSAFYKDGGYPNVMMLIVSVGWTSSLQAYFDVSTKTVSGLGGLGTITDTKIQDCGNGWYRCSITGHFHDASAGASIATYVGGAGIFVGDNAAGAYAWGFQIEQGSLSSYIATSGGSASRSAETMQAPVVDTGWTDLYTLMYAPGTLPWGHPSLWDGRMDKESALLYSMPWLFVFDDNKNARYWLIEFSDVGNPDGYFQLPRVVIATGWQPTHNFIYGVSILNSDDTQVQTTPGGADFFDQRAKRRIARFSINHLPEAEALAWANDMQYRLGISGQVYFVYNPDEPENWPRRCFLACMSALSPLVAATHGRMDTIFELTEIIA